MLNNTTTLIRDTQTMDGCQAAAHVAYAYSEAAAVFPITPSSPMAELCDEWAGNGRKNIYGCPMVISQMQSEAGAAAAVHGALLAGTLATTFTASQGLLLMLPNLYRMAGELLPGVIHVAARSIATHALSIFGDHSDIYACRQTGTAIFSESSVQEVMDLSPVAHLAAQESRIPFVNFFDGFRTSHELHKIKVWNYQDLASMLNRKAVADFRERALHPFHGKVYGSAQNPDIFFQAREASNPFYQALPQIVERTLEKINALLGTSYGLFDYYGAPDAKHVIIAMGSICETIKEYLGSVPEKKYGLINVHLYRPFSAVHLAEKLPESVRQITVLDRTKEPGAPGDPLYLDVVAALVQCGFPVCAAQSPSASVRVLRASSQNAETASDMAASALTAPKTAPTDSAAAAPKTAQADSAAAAPKTTQAASAAAAPKTTQAASAAAAPKTAQAASAAAAPKTAQKTPEKGIRVFSGRYGLSSKDTTPDQIAAIYNNCSKTRFTVGITDDVTHLSLPVPPIHETASSDIVSCKFWGLGGDGTVSATKNAIKIIGNHTDMDAQGYFEYDSKKSRGLTISHLRFGKTPIHSAYLIHKADLVACHNPVYLHKYDMVREVKDGGVFLINFHVEKQEENCKDTEQIRQKNAHPEECYTKCHTCTNGFSEIASGAEITSAHDNITGSNNASFDNRTDDNSTSHNRNDRVNAVSVRAQLDAYLPEATKAYIARHGIRLFVIDAIGIGKEIGLNNKISTILQAAFFAVSGLMDPADARQWMKEAAEKSYGKNGGKILEMNRTAIDRGFSEVLEIEIPESWADCTLPEKQHSVPDTGQENRPDIPCAFPTGSQTAPDNTPIAGLQEPCLTDAGAASSASCTAASAPMQKGSSPTGSQAALDNTPLPDRPEMMDFVKNIQQPVTDQRGNELPVSAFLPYADGCTPPGSSAHERRAVATEIPVWKPENCIQCTRCSFVCPHAVIRPAVLKEPHPSDAPQGLQSIPMMGMDGCSFAITISSSDCTGCGTCAAVCPGKQKPGEEKPSKALEMVPVNRLLESGAFARNQDIFDYCKPLLPCREAAEKFRPDTPKGSQFLRPLMEFSGACAGCGETAYVKLLTQLFGDRMYIANATGCSSIWANSSPSCAYTLDENGHGPAWSNSLFEDAAEFGYGMLMAQEAAAKRHILSCQNTSPTVQWIIGGDGWAYDIGFSGLDHVLASGKNINILVLNTEVYSNTGGQASKATPLGSTAKFASGGKHTPKKDLAAMAMTYDTVYVAQIAMGADFNQTVRAITEAAAYPGPSLIIAYATCIAHGIRAGLGSTPHEAKKAVDAGYYHLFRFNPSLREQGKNPFILDSGEPKLDYETFLDGEIRYDSLKRYRPGEAEELFRQAAARSRERYQYLKKLERFYADSQT